MVSFHIVDEAVIDATPQEVEQALADEAAGRSNWWAPQLQMRLLEGRTPQEVGAVTEYRVKANGRADRPGALRFVTRVTQYEPGRVVSEYFDGAFRGHAVVTAEAVSQGGTRVRTDWQTRTHGLLLAIVARVVDIGAGYSRVMQDGYAGMWRYIAENRPSAAA